MIRISHLLLTFQVRFHFLQGKPPQSLLGSWYADWWFKLSGLKVKRVGTNDKMMSHQESRCQPRLLGCPACSWAVVCRQILMIGSPWGKEGLIIEFTNFFFFLIFYCNTIDLQCCIHFRCMAKWVRYVYLSFPMFFSPIDCIGNLHWIMSRYIYCIICYTVVYFMYSTVYMSIPVSSFISPTSLTFGNHKFVFHFVVQSLSRVRLFVTPWPAVR